MKNIIFAIVLLQIHMVAKADLMPLTAGFVQFKIPATQEQLDSGVSTRAFCGGVKIGKLQYLTAAHCVNEIIPSFGKLKAGQLIQIDGIKSLVTAIRYPKNTLEIAKTEIKCFESEGCHPPKDPNWIDIAIIEIENENSLPIASINPNIESTGDFIVSGNELSSETFVKSAAKAKLIESNSIIGWVWLDPNEGVSVNPGDSGSPVWAVSKNGIAELIGITSRMGSPTIMGFIFISNVLEEIGIN